MNNIPDSEDRVSSPDLADATQTHPPLDASRDAWNYEQTVEKIEAIIARIESGKLDLAEVFNEFATAVESLQTCETFLAERQRQMNLLIETLKDEPEF